ncbi:porin family protein [uncultured Bacteroides sp.]|uniref:porin family protein n=1 Tax=uncultured Bacteroides sp. TaxID=162156 RepID=UPI0026279BF3|nr:porin family protein [uncultured Bacteroides sp.]
MIIKKYISILVCFLCWLNVTETQAQLQEQKHNFSIGISGGVNFSNVDFAPRIKQGYLVGPQMGFTARYISEKYFSMICGIQAEVNYSQRGWKEVIEDNSGDSYQRAMNYVEVPLLAHLAFGKEHGNGARFILNLGPQIGFLIGEKETHAMPSIQKEQYGKAAENGFDYGLIGGGGLEIRTGIGHFLLEGRYYFGLSDFFNSTKKDYFSRSAHTYICGKITYLFDIRK